MKNVTVSISDDIYRRARIKAAERGTSLSALVRQFLIEVTGAEGDFERRMKAQDEIIASIRKFSAENRLSRDDIHDRNAVR